MDLLTDNKAYVAKSRRKGQTQLNGIMKQIFQIVFEKDIDLQMHYKPSKLNPADRPSRGMEMMETTLSEKYAH